MEIDKTDEQNTRRMNTYVEKIGNYIKENSKYIKNVWRYFRAKFQLVALERTSKD